MTAPSDQLCISPELNRIVGLVSRGFGINPDAARMMVVQIIGEIIGRPLKAGSAAPEEQPCGF